MYVRVLSQGHATEWVYILGVAKIFNIFGVCLLLLIFLGETVHAGSKPTY